MKKFTVVLLVIALFMSLRVSAQSSEYNLSVFYDDETKILNISGKIGNENKLPVTVIVDNYIAEGKSFSADSLPLIIDIYKLGENGIAEFAVPIPSDMPSGKYAIYFNCTTYGKHSESFMVPAAQGSAELEEALGAINSASSSDMGTMLKEYGIELGFDTDGFSSDELGFMGELVVSWREQDYVTSTLAEALRKASVINMLSQGVEVSSVMPKYADIFGTSASDYAGLSQGARAKLEVFLPGAEFKGESIADVYADILALSKISGAENRVEMRDEILSYESVLGLDMTDYEKLSSTKKNIVFTNLFEDKEKMTSLDDIKDMFEDEVSAQSPKNNSSGGSSSNKGGGVSVSKGTITAPAEIMKPVYEEVQESPKPENEKTTLNFSDLDNHFAKDAVETFVSLGIIAGYPDGSFRPDAPVNRAEFAKMAALTFDIKDSRETAFSDVNDNDWYAPYIKALYAKNVLKGYDGKVFPIDNLKREDAAVMIHRLMNFEESVAPVPCSDKESISGYALGAVSSLYEKGIMRGDGVSFNAQSTITRGEVAVLLSNAISYYSISEGGE